MGDEQKGVPVSVGEMTGDFSGRKRQELPPELQPKSKMEYKPRRWAGGYPYEQEFNVSEGGSDVLRFPFIRRPKEGETARDFWEFAFPEPKKGEGAIEYIEGLWEKHAPGPPKEEK